MSKQYEFVRSVCVDGKTFLAGDVFEAGDIPADHLESCLRVGHVREVDASAFRAMADEALKAAAELTQQAEKVSEAVKETIDSDSKEPAKKKK